MKNFRSSIASEPGVNISTYSLHQGEGKVLNFRELGEEFWHILKKEEENVRFKPEIWSKLHCLNYKKSPI